MGIILTYRRHWLILILFVFISSCATTGSREITPEEISEIDNLIAANRYYPALKLSGNVSIKDFLDGVGWAGTAASVAVLRPYSVRASFHSKVGWSWLFVVSNPDEIGLSIPGRGISEVFPRKQDGSSGIIKIGLFEIYGDDFIRLVHPGLDREWVEDGRGRFSRGVLTVTYPGVEYLIRFDGKKRVEVVEIKRENSSKLKVEYSYREGESTSMEGFGVNFNDLLKLDFTQIAQFESISDSIFVIPPGLRQE